MTDLLRVPYEILLHNIEKYPYVFPRISVSKLNKLRITDIALYSMITADNAKYLTDLIIDILTKYNIDICKLNGLDLGCNTGGILYYLLKHCNHVTGIEFEPLHVDICYHNIKTIDHKLLNKLTLLYGDVEEIFMGSSINIVNSKYYNSKYIKPRSKNSDRLKNIGLVYIGTPFIDLKYGNTRVESLILKIKELYKPRIIIVQLPCGISNSIHSIFYKRSLDKMLQLLHSTYDISFMFDYKQNDKCSNLHMILVKHKKNSIPRMTHNIRLKNESTLQNILNSIVRKFDIKCYSHKFNIKNIWREIYSKSYYTNVLYNNKKLIFNSITRGNTGDVVPVSFSVKHTFDTSIMNKRRNLKCNVKYDRFTDTIVDVLVAHPL